ncbi:MAG TPA: hypothetical protein VMI73_26865 [Trebonia sp.]|nr:hypothetical protein [Trebonia sp.]
MAAELAVVGGFAGFEAGDGLPADLKLVQGRVELAGGHRRLQGNKGSPGLTARGQPGGSGSAPVPAVSSGPDPGQRPRPGPGQERGSCPESERCAGPWPGLGGSGPVQERASGRLHTGDAWRRRERR